jgi:glycosyltransferase involved in cell wall biosynthesis
MECAEALGYRVISWRVDGGPSSFRSDAMAAIRAIRAIRAVNPSVLHSWHTRSFEIVATLAKFLGRPSTGTLHDHPQSEGYSRLRHKLLRWGADRMTAIACVSQAQLTACQALNWRTPLDLIRNGLPNIAPAPPPDERTHIRVGFLGCSERWKGADLVLALARAGPPAVSEWNLYGDLTPSSHPALHSLASLAPTVRYLGRRSINEILDQCDVIIHPSERFDPFPTVLLEAARGGRPVVATNVGGTSEIVTHEATGFLFAPGDHEAAAQRLSQLAAEPTLRHRFAETARRRYEKLFTVGPMVESYARFWDRLSSEAGGIR